MDLKQITLEVCKIATGAGIFLAEERKNFRKDLVVEKNAHDYVSYVDKEAEKLIVAKLKQLLPEAGFLTEESTIAYTESEYTWVIDPLDGTTNFIHDYGPYGVSIALRDTNELLVGVVYEVTRGECFYAWKSGKAYLNGETIQVSDINVIDKAFVGLDLPYDANRFKPVLNHLVNELYGNAASLRISGSAALSICYVAAGRYDFWLESFIQPWDFSAGALIVKQAGGIVTDYRGNELSNTSQHIVVSNGLLHTSAQKLVMPFIERIL